MPDSIHPFDEWFRVARIDRISELSDAMTKVREGNMVEIPDRVRQEFAQGHRR